MNYPKKAAWSLALVLLVLLALVPMRASADNNKLDALQAEMDAILLKYLGTTELTNDEIIDKVSAMTWDEMEAALADRDALAPLMAELSPEELAQLEESYANTDTIVCFYETIELTMTPAFYAATGTHTPITGVTVGVSGATDNSMSSEAVTVTAKGSAGIFGFGAEAKTATITITNDSGATAKIAFDWSATSVNELKIDGTKYTGASGSFSKDLDAETSFTITITTAKNSTINTLVMSNFSIQPIITEGTVTVSSNLGLGYGYIQVDGVDITAYNYKGTDVTITDAGATFKAAANTKGITYNGTTVATSSKYAHFVAWVNPDTMEILSLSASYTIKPTTANIKIKAIFSKSYSVEAFFQVGNTLYEGLGNALQAFEDGVGSVITLRSTGSILANKSFTIPEGCTLLIPYDAAGTVFTTAPVNTTSTTKVSAYKTLYMRAGSSLTIDGTLSLAGRHYYARGNKSTGCVNVGATGMIRMYSNTNIIVNGSLYCYGFIYTSTQGYGQVTVNNGAEVYEYFQLEDFRGGTQTFTGMEHEVFPFSQYFVQNVQVPMTLHYGAKEYAYTTLYLSSSAVSKAIQFIGSSDCFVTMSEGASVTKTYDINTDRVTISLNGSSSVSNFALSMSFYSFDTADYVMPIPSYMTLKVESGNATVNQDIALIPGSRLEIDEGATVQLGNGTRIYVYDQDVWGTYNWDKAADTNNSKFQIVRYAASRAYTRTEADLIDAAILVNGTLNVSAGALYTTEGNANIHSTGAGSITLKPGSESVTYQYIQGYTETTTDETTGAETEITHSEEYVNISITSAQLLNGDGTYVATADGTSTTSTYTYVNGKWCKNHNITSSVTTEATCGTAGKKTHSCSGGCGTSYIEEIAATGNHSYSDATYTAASTCSGCTATVTSACIGETQYSTLKEAVEAAETGSTITLLTNISGQVPIGKLLTIDRNGYTAELKAENGFVITETDGVVSTLIKIMATNVKADDGLDIYFYVLQSAFDGTNYQACITREYYGKDPVSLDPINLADWEKVTIEGTDYYRFCYSGIAAKEMMDPVTVVIKSGDSVVSKVYTETIHTYAVRTLEKIVPAEDGTSELGTALVDMLKYGAEAQKYFNYNAENLADNNIDAYSQWASSAHGEIDSYLVKDPKLVAVSVSAKNKLMLTFYFSNITTNMTAKITYTNHSGTPVTYTVNGDQFISYNGWYGVDVTGLAIADGRQIVTCEIMDGETVVASVKDSVEGYVARDQSSAADVLDMLMRFVDSAYAYFH